MPQPILTAGVQVAAVYFYCGGVGGGSGDGGGGDPVEEEPALPVQLGVLGSLNLLVQLRGFDIGKWDSVNVD